MAVGDLPLRGQDLDALDPDTHRRLRELSFVFLGMLVMLPPLSVRYIFLGMWQIAAVMAVTTVAASGAILLLRRTHDTVLVGVIGCVLLFTQLLASVLVSGGYSGPMMSWFYILPIFGALLVGPRSGVALTVLVIAFTALFWRLPHMGVEIPNMIPMEHRDLQSFIPRVTALLALGGLLIALQSQRRFITSRLEDETEAQRELRREALLSQREAEVANTAKNRFLANLSHELRTPLNTIMGYSELILEERQGAGDGTHEDAEHILGAAVHLSHLFETLFFLTSLESGSLEVAPTHFAPRESLSGLLAEFEALAAQKGLEFELECPEDLHAMTDPALLLHLLRGLLDNALKFTHEGHVRLVAALDEGSGEVCFSVEDTGEGMSEEARARALEPFSQADAFEQRVHDGLGLGLTVCVRIAALLGARLEIDSRLGHGTRASLHLPHATG